MTVLTNQEIYEIVYKGLESQGFERSTKQFSSSMNSNSCAYRGDGGKKCAVGHLIPDEVYSKVIEDSPFCFLTRETLSDGITLNPIKEWLDETISPDSYQFIGDLQSAHDGSNTPKFMEQYLRMVKGRYLDA